MPRRCSLLTKATQPNGPAHAWLDFGGNQRMVGASLWECRGRNGPCATGKGVRVTLRLTSSSSASPARAVKSAEPLVFDRAPQQVEHMIDQGLAFARVEDAIEAGPFADRYKASLWLLAWSLREPAIQRQDALLFAGAFSATAAARLPSSPKPSSKRCALTLVTTPVSVSTRS
jgi:hypothetical protein